MEYKESFSGQGTLAAIQQRFPSKKWHGQQCKPTNVMQNNQYKINFKLLYIK
jgi:hypothetical protein